MKKTKSVGSMALASLAGIARRYCISSAAFIFSGLLVPAGALPGSTAASTDSSAQSVDTRIESSVVKIFCTQRLPDPFRPWVKQNPQEVSGSGVVIEGDRILTNAHVVQYATQIQVQASQAGDKISASLAAFAPGIDLAVLTLDDKSFFAKHQPLPRAGALPDVKDAVMAYGFPTGGSNLSITKGIVSRIEFGYYNNRVAGLRVQIDAAINPGNSGGPAVVGDKMVGLSFSRLGGAENIGYIIPCEEIDLFLKDIADGRYDGKPAMMDDLQTLENPALRGYLKLDKDVEGIVVHQPASSAASYPLKEWDAITKIGEAAVDDQGMSMVGNLRVRFQYFVQKVAKNGTLPLTVVRAGKTMKIQLPVAPPDHLLIPDLEGTYPRYFVYGPVVFSAATSQFVAGISAGAGGASMANAYAYLGNPLFTRRGEKPAFNGEELVVVASPFLPHDMAKGYSSPVTQVVQAVNGTAVKNLRHLVELLRDCQADFVCLQFAGRSGETLVFPRKEMAAATDDILNDNGIRSQGSPDELAVWNAKRK